MANNILQILLHSHWKSLKILWIIQTLSLFLTPYLEKSFISKQYDLITFSRGYFSKASQFPPNFEGTERVWKTS